MEDFKVNILGTDYDVLFRNEKEDKKLKTMYGYCDYTVKKIVIDNLKEIDLKVGNPIFIINDTIRHEIVHAFLNESGLQECSEWAKNEELIDWIAIQLPKMIKAMKDYI